jgi:hypothetical protein
VRAVVSTPGVTAAAADRSIYQSEDGGTTWTHLATLDFRVTALAVHPQGGYYAGNGLVDLVSQDLMRVLPDGAVLPAGLRRFVEHILVQPDGVVYVGGLTLDATGFYRSANGGAPWTHVGCPGYVRGIVADAQGTVYAAMNPYAVDYGDLPACGVIQASGNGTDWVTRNRGLGKATVYELAAGAGTVYASADWTIQWTTDDGVSWTEVETPLPNLDWPEEGMRRLAVHPDGTLFAVHSTSPMYRSIDHGRTWTELPFDSVIPPHAIAVTPQGKLLVATLSWPSGGNDLWQSTDLGETWTTVMSVGYPAWIVSMAAGPLDRVAVVSTQGISIGSDGEAWTDIPLSLPYPQHGRAAFSPDETSVYVADGYQVRRWIEESGTWVPSAIPPFPGAADVAVDADGRVYVASSTAVGWMAPGDSAWNTVLAGGVASGWTIGYRPRLILAPDGYLYFGTEHDGAYRSATPARSPTDVPDRDLDVLAHWAATPNPARSGASVTFSLTRSSPVEIGVYDVRGRAVATLANGEFNAGAHTVAWIAADRAPSGVYVYRLRAGDAVRQGRIVLVR